jgi:hypothetical protein
VEMSSGFWSDRLSTCRPTKHISDHLPTDQSQTARWQSRRSQKRSRSCLQASGPTGCPPVNRPITYQITWQPTNHRSPDGKGSDPREDRGVVLGFLVRPAIHLSTDYHISDHLPTDQITPADLSGVAGPPVNPVQLSIRSTCQPTITDQITCHPTK